MADPYVRCTYLRSCKKECDIPIEGDLSGSFPKWLKGSLIRIGSGLLEVGPDKYVNVFDGLALMHRFEFQDGRVSYSNRFLRSDAYTSNMRANRIAVSELCTPAVVPDPCKTIFQRLASYFFPDMTDNDLVNVIMYGGETYACSETNYIWKVDPQTLESVKKVNVTKFMAVNTITAHAHDEEGTVYNVGCSFNGLTPTYTVCEFPLKDKKIGESCFEEGRIVARCPSLSYFNTQYHHSFGMSPNYFVIVDQPLYFSLPSFLKSHLLGRAAGDALSFDNNAPTRFRVLRRSDGKEVSTHYISDCFYVFHHVNTYEFDDRHLVVDLCAYNNGEILKVLYVDSLEHLFKNLDAPPPPFQTELRRYVIPIGDDIMANESNLVTMPSTSASAIKKSDGTVHLKHEALCDNSKWYPEMPRINYEKYNGKNYRYAYALGRRDLRTQTYLVKIDVTSKTTITWFEIGTVPSEPVFVADPASDSEDSGIILASLLYDEDDKKVSILALRAESFKEVGRVTFRTEGSVPADFHGTFIPKT